MKFPRKWLLASSVFTSVVFGAPALAQETTTTTTTTTEEVVTEVVITGSRIKGKEYTSASPVTVITSERSTAAGLISASEILQSTGAAASSGQINNTFTGFVVGGGGGINTVSLRGLGAQRSLVLINGRRMPPAGVGGTVGPVDLNTIPSAFVSRYEILKDGASSIYGSDAVAGVVNVITRANYEGFNLEGTTNITEQGGGETYQLSGMWGKSFDKGHFAVSAEAYEQKALVAGDRDSFACPTDNFYYGDDRADAIDPTTGNYKCYTHGIEGYVGTYLPSDVFGLSFFGSRAISPGSTTNGVPGWAFIPYEARSFNDPRGLSATILSPVKRFTLFAQGEYRPDWLGGAELYSELMYTKREFEQVAWAQFFPYYHEQSSANPFSVGTVAANPILECDTIEEFFGPGTTCNETFAELGYPGLVANPIVLYESQREQDVETYRLLGGVRGDWGKWSYDAYLSHSKSKGDYSQTAIYNDRVDYGTGTNQLTLGLMPGGVCGTGAPAGCVPLDLFNQAALEDGQFSQAVLDYYFTRDAGSTEYTQTIMEASMTGDLFELPAGPLGSAFGISIRKDEIDDTPGPLSIAQNIWGSTTAGVTRGDDTLSEVYGELEAPVFRNLPFIKDFKVNLSARYSNYDSVGSDTTYKVGMNWVVDDTLRIRATHGTSFRAPALYELYLNDQTSFLAQSQVDPCINYGQVGEGGGFVKNEQVRANCAAEGLPEDYAGAGSSAQIFTGGGLDLKPETSEATTFGIVLTPPDTGFKFAIDFWKIKVEDQISSSGAGVVGACYASFDFPTNGFCNLFERSTLDNSITAIDASYRNIPTEEVQGIDYTAAYEKEFNFGTLAIDLEATYTKEYLSQLFPGDVVYDYQGLIGEPEWTGRVQTRFEHKDWTVNYTLNYTGSSSNMDRFGEDGTVGTDIFYAVGATYAAETNEFYTHDISVRYEAKEWSILAGISNFTDEEPPILGNGSSFTRLGNYPLSSQYYEGFLGRQFFLRVSKDF
ncbi:TonB-dependent receptor [Asticcacaulis sp. ZE23SCel15]|uniref:TonB-dependent receptor domain-containing protein n=1 Tax=Asticcacaulis sp. ZE23SCel15 TaxID=3059027 RepID=UPI00265E01D4|nr:TonB-dependent receptor [Asticcacaulis sp. ZE23SCel15]WKL55996.1 TonB-dependent receptor [Asticcacaulis sp. ZE23SCel15]